VIIMIIILTALGGNLTGMYLGYGVAFARFNGITTRKEAARWVAGWPYYAYKLWRLERAE
jgi:hypothetical protein